MTHVTSRAAFRLSPPAVLSAERAPALAGNRTALRDALAAKRATMAALEAEWVSASETDLRRNATGRIRIDDRGTWDKITWDRYLTAATAHEPDYKPRIMRLLREISSLEALLQMPAAVAASAA